MLITRSEFQFVFNIRVIVSYTIYNKSQNNYMHYLRVKSLLLRYWQSCLLVGFQNCLSVQSNGKSTEPSSPPLPTLTYAYIKRQLINSQSQSLQYYNRIQKRWLVEVRELDYSSCPLAQVSDFKSINVWIDSENSNIFFFTLNRRTRVHILCKS